MHCKKCGGRMYVDAMFSEANKIDVFCIMCGKRVYVSKYDNPFGKWLYERSKI